MNPAIQTRRLTKHYGATVGIEDLDLDVEVGQVFGFLGPNGAGKSTTIRVLLDLIRPTEGHATVLGLDARRHSLEIRRRVGYLPGELALYERMNGRQLIQHIAALRGMEGVGEARELAERLELALENPIRSYSSGNRQKLGLVQAFMHRPELLILDEPTSGLDPLIQQEFQAMVAEARNEGRTVFLSSHVLPEVERMADRVAIIRGGKLVTAQTVAELKERAVQRMVFRFTDPPPRDLFLQLPSVHSVERTDGGRSVAVVLSGSVDAVLKQASRHEVTRLISGEGDLEEVFLTFYGPPEDRDAR